MNFQKETTTMKINGSIRKMQNQVALGKTKNQVFFIRPAFFFFPMQANPHGEGEKVPPSSLFYFILFHPFKPKPTTVPLPAPVSNGLKQPSFRSNA